MEIGAAPVAPQLGISPLVPGVDQGLHRYLSVHESGIGTEWVAPPRRVGPAGAAAGNPLTLNRGSGEGRLSGYGAAA
jgi:hypothetical protein